MRDATVGATLLVLLVALPCAYSTSAVANKSNVEYRISWDDVNVEMSKYGRKSDTVIVVAKKGPAHARTVQAAVDMVPPGNARRIKILIRAGTYKEKVVVPATKPFVSFIGEGKEATAITWNSSASDLGPNGQVLGTAASASVAVDSDYFCAKDITFKNNAPQPRPGESGKQAVALSVSGDKAVFIHCGISGSQDTLFDNKGRHFFWRCHIRGSIDFVFGNGRSLYENCVLRSTAASYGAVAASQRNSSLDNSGFSFVRCKIKGSGMMYLGRAWGRYARIVYSLCHFADIIVPQGWYDWGDPSRRRTVFFGEYKCSGAGSSLSGRVPWSKSLSYNEVKPFLGRQFIDGQDWLALGL